MARRGRSLREMRAEYEAAEARGLISADEKTKRADRGQREQQARPSATSRMKVVWAVCDLGGRSVKRFEYSDKAAAEAFAEELKAKGKGRHFVRAEKVPMADG